MRTIEQKIYVGQTALQIQLDTKIDLTTGSIFLIKYSDPENDIDSWPASVVGDAADGIIGTDDPPALIPGLYTMWSHVTFADGSSAPGDPVTFRAYEEGK